MRLRYYGVGGKIIELAREARLSATLETILNLPHATIEPFRYQACDWAQREANRDSQEAGTLVAFFSTHACFRVRDTYRWTIDRHHRLLNADICVTLVDDIAAIQTRLVRDPRWVGMSFEELLEWQTQEIERTDYWAENNLECERPRNFIVPIYDLCKILPNLILRRSEMRRVYFSFPITHAPQDVRERAVSFLRRLREKYIVFDPGAITDYETVDGWKKDKITQAKDATELQRLLENVGNKTVERDYTLIRQSDMIIVYYPPTRVYVPVQPSAEVSGKRLVKALSDEGELRLVEDEKFLLSAGVISEMVTCYTQGGKVYAVWLSEQDPSPFFRYHCHRIFKGSNAEEELLLADLG